MITGFTVGVECDACRKAFAYPQVEPGRPVDDAEQYLLEHGWTTKPGKHVCPRCSPTPSIPDMHRSAT